VDESARGVGVGTQLVNAALSSAQNLGIGKVTLEVTDTNSRAKRLYGSLGFRIVGENSYGILTKEAGVKKLYIMEKCLAP